MTKGVEVRFEAENIALIAYRGRRAGFSVVKHGDTSMLRYPSSGGVYGSSARPDGMEKTGVLRRLCRRWAVLDTSWLI